MRMIISWPNTRAAQGGNGLIENGKKFETGRALKGKVRKNVKGYLVYTKLFGGTRMKLVQPLTLVSYKRRVLGF